MGAVVPPDDGVEGVDELAAVDVVERAPLQPSQAHNVEAPSASKRSAPSREWPRRRAPARRCSRLGAMRCSPHCMLSSVIRCRSSFGVSRCLGSLASLALLALLAACDSGTPPTLPSLDSSTVEVSETLRLQIPIDNPSGRPVRLSFEAPPRLAAVESVTFISTTPTGGEFRYTPLASHVGVQEFRIRLSSPGGELYDEETAIVEVVASAESAPVFVEPGAGGTYDLSRDPCVRFAVEVRDDDSPGVDIRARTDLPRGALLTPEGSKTASFEWCPTNDQIAAAERWTIKLEADDTDHAPVPHDFVVVLRSSGSGDCSAVAGTAPEITVLAPESGDRVVSGAGYEVRVRVVDDRGLREAPLLYWTTETPSDTSRPDVTEFEQATFLAGSAANEYVARVPSLGLATDASREVFFVIAASDNDDPDGTTCDQRSETPLGSFFAVGGVGGELVTCAPCSSSAECASGVCATAAGGTRCADDCTDTCGSGLSCGAVTTIEGGASIRACGPLATACSATPMCMNDSAEPNDTTATATRLTSSAMGRICTDDEDLFRVLTQRGTRVRATLSGFSSTSDLDLDLRSSSGRILAVSQGYTSTEMIEHCVAEDGDVYAVVYSVAPTDTAYTLSVETDAAGCCVNDLHEPDDSVATARRLTGTAPFDFEGTLCLMDNDYVSFDVTQPTNVQVTVAGEGLAIIDIELFDSTGTSIARSGEDGISHNITTPGRYAVRVFGYMNAGDDYVGEIRFGTPSNTCTRSLECASGQVCNGSSCQSDDCAPSGTSPRSTCPASHLCPDPGPANELSDCAASCTVNADCRASESCKWFAEGRGCAQRGDGTAGAACTTFRDCGAQRACAEWPGGYCARVGCATSSDCEQGTYCAERGGVRACAIDCSRDASRCRSGYACVSLTDQSGMPRQLCVP